jgi:hypothetical protein
MSKKRFRKRKAELIFPKPIPLSSVLGPRSTGILGNALAITVLPKVNHDH